jgi:hypothetical protein
LRQDFFRTLVFPNSRGLRSHLGSSQPFGLPLMFPHGQMELKFVLKIAVQLLAACKRPQTEPAIVDHSLLKS